MRSPTMEFDDYGIHTTYWNCPLKFIPKSIYKFLDIMDYYKTFPSAPFPSMENVSLRFWLAHKYYDSKLSEFLEKKDKQGK